MAPVGRGESVTHLGCGDELQLGPVLELDVLIADAVRVGSPGLEGESQLAVFLRRALQVSDGDRDMVESDDGSDPGSLTVRCRGIGSAEPYDSDQDRDPQQRTQSRSQTSACHREMTCPALSSVEICPMIVRSRQLSGQGYLEGGT